jgi:hypothetical protein
MRDPDFDIDGWSLDDGEELHREAPETFWIPALNDRQSLQPGDFAKLVFRISVDDPNSPVSVERMWVVVRERVTEGYIGILDNEPDGIAENDDLWLGVEIPFAPRHVINVEPRNDESIALAASEPRRRWPRP